MPSRPEPGWPDLASATESRRFSPVSYTHLFLEQLGARGTAQRRLAALGRKVERRAGVQIQRPAHGLGVDERLGMWRQPARVFDGRRARSLVAHRRVGELKLCLLYTSVMGDMRQAHRERTSGTGLDAAVGTAANLATPLLDNPPTRMSQTGVDAQDNQANLPSPQAQRKTRPRASFTNVCSRIAQRGQDA